MADQRAQYTEEPVGANHPTKADTINRLALVEHNNDGTHKVITLDITNTAVGIGYIPFGSAKVTIYGSNVGYQCLSASATQNFYFGIKDTDGNKLYIGRGHSPAQGVTPAIVIEPSLDRVGIGSITAPSAKLHLPAGTATAGTAPLKIDNGTVMTTAEANAVENDGTDLFYTSNSDVTRRRLVHSHSGVAPSGITPTGSPYTYQNTNSFDADVLVGGGTMSLIEFSRDGTTWYNINAGVAGMFSLSPSDRLRITYTVAPTMTLIPR